jgi:heme oxygenase (biliverdin-IX-beta and delta-forming)
MEIRNQEVTNKRTDQPFLNQLRQHTQASHRALEQLPVSLSITSPSLTLEAYATYLKLMRNVLVDAEATLFPLLAEVVPDLQKRKKVQLIDSDLRFIGHPVSIASSHPLTSAHLPLSQAFALGMLYVIEGSILGGRFILKNVQETLGLSPSEGASYFAGYGDSTSSLWKNFLEALTSYEARTNSGEEIINGAEHAFRNIHRHFEAAIP